MYCDNKYGRWSADTADLLCLAQIYSHYAAYTVHKSIWVHIAFLSFFRAAVLIFIYFHLAYCAHAKLLFYEYEWANVCVCVFARHVMIDYESVSRQFSLRQNPSITVYKSFNFCCVPNPDRNSRSPWPERTQKNCMRKREIIFIKTWRKAFP